MDQPLIVQAEYSFKGGNNDELCFKKGDLITVTQREEGGWWEGTLNDKTGWFPSNYVMEYKAPLPITDSIRPPEEIQEYRSVVLKDLLDSERAHVAEIQGLLENFLEPLQQTQILNADEYAQLMCNFVEVVKTHEELLTQMEECNDRVGKLFLNKAPYMKQVHQAYCAQHPKAIVILDKYKDELEKYMERQGAATPGLLVLTTGLSKPFRRLDKYSAMLQELERHMESSHPDRGDTQRSVAVYKDIAATCSATRRQKELELQVLTGPVRGWQGQELSSLGEIIHMGSDVDTLLILSVSQRMSAFIYEGKLPLTGIIVNRLEDSDTFKNAFEINSPLIDRIVAVCQGPNDANKWVELLTSTNVSMPIGIKRQLSNLSNASIGGAHISTPPNHFSYNLDARGYCTRFSLCAYYNTPQQATYRITLPPSNYPPTAPYANLSDHFAKLVKKGLLKGFLIKMLLYPESRQSIDMKSIPLRKRRCHKASKKLIKKFTNEEADSGSSDRTELERQDAFELPTDSESEGEDIDVHDDFEFIKFNSDKRGLEGCDSFASAGTFIDHGSGAASPHKARHCSSINLINLDSMSDEESKPMKKESLVIGSKTMKAIARKSSQQSFIIHTSEAHLELGSHMTTLEKPALLQQQTSENSEMSSCYNGRALGAAYVACENLADLSDDAKIKNTTSELTISPPERHSMPNMFVGNRFNRSSKTAVYVPTWKDRQDMQNQSADVAESCDITTEDEIHSSCLDLPASCRDAPDKLTAELLYNFEESDVIAPPSMYKSLGQSQNQTMTNMPGSVSQTELCIEPKRSSRDSQKRESVKRCISYHYVPLANETPAQPNRNNSNPNLKTASNDPTPHCPSSSLPNTQAQPTTQRFGNGDEVDGHQSSSKCRCCESSQCPSPRSSDSGLAGSCTITSPDPPQNEEAYEAYYDVDGSLKLISKTANAAETNDLTRFDVCGTFREKFLEAIQQTNEMQQQTCTATQSQLPTTTLTSTTAEFQINRKSIYINSLASTNSHEAAAATSSHTPNSNAENSDDINPETGMFRSGMYAHWWKKETLPKDVIKGIAKVYNKRLPSAQSSKESHCSVCSSCFCSMEASGFSEGATYCSICQDCSSSFCSVSRNDLPTNTTTTITAADCPLCCNTRNSTHRKSNTASVLASPSSSFDCPICSGAYIARPDSLGSIREDAQQYQPQQQHHYQQQQQQQAFAEGKHFELNIIFYIFMSPPANMSLLSQRMNSQQQQQQQQQQSTTNSMVGRENPSLVTVVAAAQAQSSQQQQLLQQQQQQSSSALPSQHKRSLSFNHHLSYNQYTHTQHQQPHQMHHQQQPPSLPNHPVAAQNHKSNLVQTSNSISKIMGPALPAQNMATNARTGSTKANWSITNMRPAPPLRPNLLNCNTTSGGGSSGSRSDGGGVASLNSLSNYCSGRKNQPTFEEDALVLRVFEAYCAAYQNTTRNTIHSALQPWTPCLPIRGGKLKTSKHFSTSNPHLPFLCNTGVQFPGATNVNNKQNSTSSLNSSYIWREASPNNFNLYSSSISSLNATGYRYSLTGSTGAGGVAAGAGGPVNNAINTSSGASGLDYRALSEERATRKSLNRLKSGFGSGYDNIFMTPLMPRKNKGSPKIVKNSASYQRPPTPVRNLSEDRQSSTSSVNKQLPNHPGLYDRRLNRSFETSTSHRYAGYGGGYMMGYGLKSTSLRRSTPQLPADGVDSDDPDCHQMAQKGCTEALLRNGHGAAAGSSTCAGGNGGDGDSQGHAGNWCCGLENEDMTPTLRQLWTAIRQLQQDMTQIKQIINDEVALRVNLQQLLMQHLETGSTSSSNTPKC
ncbi:Rho guanine nucleotide exchange factor 7 [Lucilia cuprina]|nr:Rho guanine nucleotide exchange factor 7 [Lucilia cuprina]